MSRKKINFEKNIFINCPFDEDYKPMLRALVFTVIDCGFEPRLASEIADSAEVRVEKIKKLIRESCFSIHDISRMEPLRRRELPRFNMPFELGLDLGCQAYGRGKLAEKKCLILEKERYRYQKTLSDISGNDIKSHNGSPEILVRRVRDWIFETTKTKAPTGTRIWQRFNEFYGDFMMAVNKSGYSDKDIQEMPIIEFITFIKEWEKTKKRF